MTRQILLFPRAGRKVTNLDDLPHVQRGMLPEMAHAEGVKDAEKTGGRIGLPYGIRVSG